MQRFTQDIHCIDRPISQHMQNTFQLTAQLVQRIVVIVIFAPAFLIPAVGLAVAGISVAHIYIKAQLPVKRCVGRALVNETTLTYPLLREMSLARAPLFSHFGTAIQGLTSIRAYGAQEAFKSGASYTTASEILVLNILDIRVIKNNQQILEGRSSILES